MEVEQVRPRLRVRTLMIAIAIFAVVFAIWALLLDIQRSLDLFYGPGGTLARERAEMFVASGTLHLSSGRYPQAEAEFTLALQSIGEPGKDDLLAAQALAGLGRSLAGQGRFAEAEPRLRSALEIRDRMTEPGGPDLKGILEAHAASLRATGRAGEAKWPEGRILMIRDDRAGARTGKSP